MLDHARPELPKAYDPAAVEGPTYRRWIEAGYFTADRNSGKPRWSMALPPPNVTGSLHIGHAFEHAFQDHLARFHRMSGKEVLWLPGMDHAGISTQVVVERELAKEGKTRFDLGREGFIQRVWAWKETSGGQILDQMRRLGDSVDWTRERFTFDEGLSKAVRHVFVSLFDEGLLYRGRRIINWCPRCLTALSDIEVEHEDVPGELAYLAYPLADGSGRHVTVATSRAETMLGDTAVAVHPRDPRYAGLVGATVALPLVDREIPIIADDAVDPEFGTGAVKVTPAHDPNDYEIGQRHGLPAIDVLTDEAVVSEAGGRFAGLDRYAARRAVKEAFAELGLLERVEEARHAVGHCQRCHTEVEPRLSEQWFVSTKPLAAKAMAVVRSGETRFVPQRFERTFFDWMEGIRDWCVSRQLWWGHRIPAWYCPDGHMTVAREDPDACATCGAPDLRQDDDVLDTWFSSALWPFSTLGWPEQTEDLAAFYPTTVLNTGYDIIFFWVARMMMMGTHFAPPTPFRIVSIHGMVRDGRGRKMSKSFGNSIDPLAFLDAYGSDALRFALLRGGGPGADVPLAEEWVEGARNFANKLWNVGRFLIGKLPQGIGPAHRPPAGAGTLADRWLLSRLERTRAEVTAAYDAFDPADAARAIYSFVWGDLADWGVELAKPRLERGGGDAAVAGGTLAFALDASLRLLHPMMPFVTEELARALSGVETVTRGPWPEPCGGDIDERAESEMAALQAMISAVRRYRSERAVPPSRRPKAFVAPADAAQAELLRAEQEAFTTLARLDVLEVLDVGGGIPERRATGPTAKLLAAGAEIHLPLGDLLDLDQELARLRKEQAELAGTREKLRAKLANPGYVQKAPAQVVDTTRERLAATEDALGKVGEQLAELRA